MSTPNVAPAGWYPDPNDGRRQRWWDGYQWTAETATWPSEAQSGPLTAPPDTDWRTPWVWLVLILPLLPILPAFLIDWSSIYRIDPVTLQPDPAAQLALLTSPAYLASVIGGWLCYALAIVFAYLDWKELRARRVPRPFHWAWTFLSSYVYGIGRGVVVHRRTGGGLAVVWVSVAILVLSIVLGVVVSVLAVAAVFAQVSSFS
ncbi:DUF2510 domain-containing protein [Naasia sp. SYSU D00948]|uniref:DUF2510 domain-containing protein n=1 Tax=Naasia sp. SYSU D00948 TaxID=2817379 RepID=UPI001B30610C|nr:DUF2510 domain-containing protein [Naasia sp. SYSU D00948]